MNCGFKNIYLLLLGQLANICILISAQKEAVAIVLVLTQNIAYVMPLTYTKKKYLILFCNMISTTKAFPKLTVYAIWSLIILTIIPAIYCIKFNFNILIEWNILSSLSTQIIITLIFDNIRLLYSSAVLFISANVLTFSTIYIKDDKFINRFTVLVILFIISINLLIYIPHLIILLIGWDGLGVTSFILIVYYQNPKSLGAGLITALTNRIGDVAILLSIAWTLKQGHWNIIHMMSSSYSICLIIAIILAALTKRAQIPFSRWLPAAIAAPTPVSALVHSSTLVTAGVFLIIRFYPFLSLQPLFNKIILFLAVSTILIAGIRATNECDIKKIIALSTLRQLGIIMTRIGLGFPQITFIHIIIHALFKALLFICAGNIINTHSHAQDLRWIGNLIQSIPVTASCLLIANSALCGIPFTAGFYSKDIIIESSIIYSCNSFIIFLILLSVRFTSFYSIRISIVVLWGPRLHKPISLLNDSNTVSSPIVLISITSIIIGAVILWILPRTENQIILPLDLKILTIIIVTAGIFIGWFSSSSLSSSTTKSINNVWHYASCIIWFLVPMASQITLKLPLTSRHLILKIVDQSWLEILGAQGINSIIINPSSSIQIYSPLMPNTYLAISVLLIISIPTILILA